MTITRTGKIPFRPSLRAMTALVWALTWVSTPATASRASEPPGTRPMTAFEVYSLYKNKSWQWGNGAGHMTDAGRLFSAWVDSENGESWAEGRWVIAETGLLCLNATWHSRQGAFPAKTCFSHRVAEGTIYQKREPDGEWYVFRHTETREDDEARKLISADLVSQKRDSIKTALGAAQLSKQ
jgi:hypothetical protein